MDKGCTIKWTLIGVFLVLGGCRTAMGFQYAPRVQNPSRGNFVGLFSNIFQQHVSQLIQPFEEFGHWGPYQRPAQQSDFERHFYNFEAQGYDVCSGEESEYSSQDFSCQYPDSEYMEQSDDCSDDEYGIRWKGSPIDQANAEIEEIIARNFQGFNGGETANDEEVGMNFKGLTKVEIHNCIPQDPEGRNEESGAESKIPENEYVVLVIKKEHILGDARKFNKTSIDAYIGGSEDLFRATSTSTQKSTTDSTTFTTKSPPMKPTKIPVTSTKAPSSTVTLPADGPVEERAFNSPQQKHLPKESPTSSTSTPKIGKDETVSQTTEGPTKFSLPFEGLNSDDANVKSTGTPTESSTTTHVPATDPPTKLLIPFMNNGRPTLIHTIVPSRTAVGGNDSKMKINKGTVQQTSENNLDSSNALDSLTSPTEPTTVVGTQNPTLVSNQLDAGKPDVPYTTTTMPTIRFDESSPLVDKSKAPEEDSTVATTPTSYSSAPTAFSVLSTGGTSPKSSSSKASASKSDPKTTSIVNDGMIAQPTSYISQPRVDEDALSEEETTSKSYLKPKTSTIVNDISPVTESLAQTSFQSTRFDDLTPVTDKTTDSGSQTPTDKTMSTTIDCKSETPSIVNHSSTLVPNSTKSSNSIEPLTTVTTIQPVTPKFAPSNDAATIVNDKSPDTGEDRPTGVGSDPLVGLDLIAENVTSTIASTTPLSIDSQSAILGSKSLNDGLPKVNEIFLEDLKPSTSNGKKTLPGDGYINDHGQNWTDSQSTDKSVVPIKDEPFESPNLVSKIPEDLEKGGPTPPGAMHYPSSGTTSKKPANSVLDAEDNSQSPNLTSSSTTSNVLDPKYAALKPSSTAENSSQSKALKPSPKLSGTDTRPTSLQPNHPNTNAMENSKDASFVSRPIQTAEVTDPSSSTESDAKLAQPTLSTTTIHPTLPAGDDIHDLGHAIRGLHDLVNKLMSTVNAPSTANPNAASGSLPSSESKTKPIQAPKEAEDTSDPPPIISAQNPGLKTDFTTTEAPPSTTETVRISEPLMDLTTEAPPSTTVTVGISQPTEANSRPDSTNNTERPSTTKSTTESANVLSSQSPKSTTEPVLEKTHVQAGLHKDSPEVVQVANLDEIKEPMKPESTVNGPKITSDQPTTLMGDALPRNKTTKPLTKNNAKNDDDSLNKDDVNADKLSSPSPDLTNQTTLNSIPKKFKATSQSPVETLSPSPVLEQEILDSNDNPVAFTEISYDASSFTSTPSEKKRPPPKGFHKILGFFSWMRGKKNTDNSTEADATKLTETAFDPFEEIVESTKNGTPVIDKDVLPENLANWFLGFRSGEDDDSSNTSSANESLSSEVLDSSAEFRDLYHSFLEAAIHNVNNVSAIVNASEPIGTPHSWWSSFRGVEDAEGETDSQSSTELEETIHNGSSIVNGSTSRWRLGRWLTKLKGFRNMLKSAPIENGSNASMSDETSSQSKGASVEGIRDDAHGPEEKIEKSENSGSWLSTFWGGVSPVNASTSLETSSESENTKENEAYGSKEQSEKSTGWFSRFWGTKDDRMNSTSAVNGTQADDASNKDFKMADSVLVEKGLSTYSTQEDLGGNSIVRTTTTSTNVEDEDDSTVRIVFTEQKSKLLSLLAEMQDAHKANETQQHSDAVSERQAISTSTQPSKHSHFHSSDFEVWSDENE